MDTILFMMAGAMISFCLGVLVGSGLHTRSLERRYRRLAQLAENLYNGESVMVEEPAEYWSDQYGAGPVYDYDPPRAEDFRVLPPRT